MRRLKRNQHVYNEISSVTCQAQPTWTTCSRPDSLNSGIFKWDVDVPDTINMHGMFRGVTAFKKRQRHLYVGRVKRNQHDQQHGLGAAAFNSDIFKWDVSGTTNMHGMFRGVTSFKKRQRHLYVGRVKRNHYEQHDLGVTAFSSGIFKWDVSGTTNMPDMFRGVTSLSGTCQEWKICTACSEVRYRLTVTFLSGTCRARPRPTCTTTCSEVWQLLTPASLSAGTYQVNQPTCTACSINYIPDLYIL